MQADCLCTAQEWDQFVTAHLSGHVLQTSSWGRFKSEFGWHARRVVVRDGKEIVAGAQVLFHRLPLGWTLAYVPKGPVYDLDHSEAVQCLFDALHRVCRANRAIALKLEPDMFESAELSARLARYGFGPSEHTIQPRRTILVDIDGREDEVLQRMKSKTRYNIRLAERKEVRVHQGSRQDVEAFNRLMIVTGERDAFGVHNPAYYERAYELLVSADLARLFIATYEGQPLAGIIVFWCGHRGWYVHGASGNEHRNKMPTYALQWAAIRWVKSRGCTIYDLWGVPDEDEETLEAQFTDRKEGLWGVYRFKRGFGGRLVRYAGAFDHVYIKPLYWLYRLALRLR